jgi:transposase
MGTSVVGIEREVEVSATPNSATGSELEREVRRLRARAERAEALVDVQKKLSQLLGIELPESNVER